MLGNFESLLIYLAIVLSPAKVKKFRLSYHSNGPSTKDQSTRPIFFPTCCVSDVT